MKKVAIAILLALTLAGCAGSIETRSITALGLACDTYASAVSFLAPKRAAGELKPAEVRTISSVREVVTPFCKKGAVVPDPRSALDIISTHVNKLAAMQKAKGG